MKRLLQGVLLCLSVQCAHAQALQDWYVDAGFGWDYADSIELDSSAARMDFDRGVFQFSGSLGRRVRDRWRIELEYSQHENAPEILYGPSIGLEIDPDREDDLTTRSVMLNVHRDFRLGAAWRPYLGVGVGVANVDLRFSDMVVNGAFVQRPRRDIVNDDDTTFAYQVIAGFTVPVTRRIDLAADFRYWRAPAVKLQEVTGDNLTTAHAVRSAFLHVRYHAPTRSSATSTEPVQPTPMRGFYLTGYLGGGFTEDMGIEDRPTIDAFDPGPTAIVALGYGWRNRWQLELEAGYRDNGVEVIELGPDIGEDAGSGAATALSLMLNGSYTFRPRALIRPFVRVGAGLVRTSIDTQVFGFCANLVCDAVERRDVFVDASATEAAAQVMAGVNVSLTPRLAFTADYRYLVTSKYSFRRADDSVFEGNMKNTSVVAGLRYALGRKRH